MRLGKTRKLECVASKAGVFLSKGTTLQGLGDQVWHMMRVQNMLF